jgi:hypothetical protein
MGIDPKTVNHDRLLIELLGNPDYSWQRAELLPTLSTLSKESQKTVTEVLGVGLNFGQFLQAEVPAAVLEEFPADLSDVVRNMYVMHSILDIAGVAGHLNSDSSIVMNSPTCASMIVARDVLVDDGIVGSIDKNKAYLEHRAQQFGTSIENGSEDSAKVRIGCMLRYSTPEEYQQLSDEYDNLPPLFKSILTRQLSRNGITDRAILPYYGPALLKALIDKSSMASSLCYFAYALDKARITDMESTEKGQTGVVVVDLGEITRMFNQGTLEISNAALNFQKHGDMLVPELT